MRFQFCPRCGTPLTYRDDHGIERPGCASCGYMYYANPVPCAGILVEDQGRMLLVKRARAPFKDYWDIPGGFLESGEHPVDGARRELLEETGLDIRVGDFLGIWMDTYGADAISTLNIFYRGQIAGGVPRPSDDAVLLGWFAPGELPPNIAFAHAPLVLAEWVRRVKG
ncbi:MAG: NUDIX domain-containing protein [Chloroflexi bacterium]|nr:NUDIX domain-containing protein [Chloroflexota bacterium]